MKCGACYFNDIVVEDMAARELEKMGAGQIVSLDVSLLWR